MNPDTLRCLLPLYPALQTPLQHAGSVHLARERVELLDAPALRELAAGHAPP